MTRVQTLAIALAAAFLIGGAGVGPLAAQDDSAEPCAAAAGADASPEASPESSPAATTEASPEASPKAGAEEECTVNIAELAYDPADIEVAIGTTVTWTNNDTVAHTATASDGEFDSGVFDPEATFSYTFEEAGTFDYTCLIHPQMEGSVVVS